MQKYLSMPYHFPTSHLPRIPNIDPTVSCSKSCQNQKGFCTLPFPNCFHKMLTMSEQPVLLGCSAQVALGCNAHTEIFVLPHHFPTNRLPRIPNSDSTVSCLEFCQIQRGFCTLPFPNGFHKLPTISQQFVLLGCIAQLAFVCNSHTDISVLPNHFLTNRLPRMAQQWSDRQLLRILPKLERLLCRTISQWF